ncbi:MAG: hypothetical protein NTU73_05840 [Ignavibacteriae bacterium]|nr:hypothetical protein [Ignavibacteriota bacterium]
MNANINSNEDKIIYEIGNLVVNFQVLERIICNTIGLFLDYYSNDESSNIMTSDINFRLLLDKLYALFIINFPEESDNKETLKSLIKEANEVAVKRNKYVHANYFLLRSIVIYDKKTTRGNNGFKRESKKIDSEEISKVILDIKELIGKFDNFYRRLLDLEYFKNKFYEPNPNEEIEE